MASAACHAVRTAGVPGIPVMHCSKIARRTFETPADLHDMPVHFLLVVMAASGDGEIWEAPTTVDPEHARRNAVHGVHDECVCTPATRP